MNPHPLHIVAFAGSLRSGSFNRKILQSANAIAVRLGADVDEIDLNTLALPVFNEDLRANGFPESVKTFKQKIEEADILFIATPEYNNSVPGPLKNAIDWASDKTNPFSGKTAVIFGASNGINGTLRAQLHLRQILASLNVTLLPQPQVFIRYAQKAFLPDGSLADERVSKQLQTLIEETLRFGRRMKENKTVQQS